MTQELEAIVWCPRCQQEKFRLFRMPVNDHGIYRHSAEPDIANKKECDCGALLERKPTNG